MQKAEGMLPCPLARAVVPSVERVLYGSDPAGCDGAKTMHLQSSSHTLRELCRCAPEPIPLGCAANG